MPAPARSSPGFAASPSRTAPSSPSAASSSQGGLPTLLRPNYRGLLYNSLWGRGEKAASNSPVASDACGPTACCGQGGGSSSEGFGFLRLPAPRRRRLPGQATSRTPSPSPANSGQRGWRGTRPAGGEAPQAAGEEGLMAMAAIEGCLCWSATLLLRPRRELSRLACTSRLMRKLVSDVSVQHLRAHAVGPDDIFETPSRVLHRVTQQAAGLDISVIAAENYSAGIDALGRLVVWGRPGWMERTYVNSLRCGQPVCGVVRFAPRSDDKEHRSEQVKLKSVCGSRHALFVLSTDGIVYYGKVARSKHGECDLQLHQLMDLAGIRITSLTTRFGQAFAVGEDGSVYAWGMHSGGDAELSCSMGFGEIRTILRPAKLPCFGSSLGRTAIASVSAGVSHTLFVSVFGEAFAVGQTECGKLGLGSAKGLAQGAGHVLSPTRLQFACAPSIKVVAAAAGDRHSLFLANCGTVFGCGSGEEGALPVYEASMDKHMCAWLPARLDRLQGFVTSIAAGVSSSFFVMEQGQVQYCGRARQSARPFSRPVWWSPEEPFHIAGLEDIKQVSVSMELSFFQWEHVLFVRNDGKLLGWGHSAHGELQPQRVSATDEMHRPLRLRHFCDRVVPIQALEMASSVAVKQC